MRSPILEALHRGTEHTTNQQRKGIETSGFRGFGKGTHYEIRGELEGFFTLWHDLA